MVEIATERRALVLFEAMLDLDETERGAWLAGQVGEDDELMERVTRLIEADRTHSLATGGALDDVTVPPPPAHIGAYRIDRLIGTGGMGSVYAASRDAGDFDHEVAIKIVKPGILSDRLADAFQRERQLLASLSHPNIARLFDGGETETNQPFLVMERVDGEPIDRWARERDADENTIIALLLQICDAVAYAHRNLIIHRDLTPSNILVDEEGRARLIDFGIARPVGQAEPETRSERRFAQLTLTPGFAAPERLAGGQSTTLTDIYSIGRIIAVLLPRPRRPELQAIVNRATEGDPAERYQTVDSIAADLRALRGGLPVSAMPQSMAYRLRKFVTRNSYATALGFLLLASVLGGLIAVTLSWQRAERERATAEQRFDEVREIARFMLFDLYSDVDKVPGTTGVLETIAETSRRYLEQLALADRNDPGLRFEIATGYHRLSNVSGNPEGSNLGRPDDAREYLDRAISMLTALQRDNPESRQYGEALASAYYSDAILRYIGEDDNQGGIDSALRSAELYDTLLDRDPAETDLQLGLLRSRLQAAKPHVWLDEPRKTEQLVGELLPDISRFASESPDDHRRAVLQASSLSTYANAISWAYEPDTDDYARAMAPMDEAIAIYERLRENEASRDEVVSPLIAALFNRAMIHSDLKRYPASLADLDRGERLVRGVLALEPDDKGMRSRLEALQSQRIFTLFDLGRIDEALSLSKRLAEEREASSRAQPENAGFARNAAISRFNYADLLKNAGRGADACKNFASAKAGFDRLKRLGEIAEGDRRQSLDPLNAALADC